MTEPEPAPAASAPHRHRVKRSRARFWRSVLEFLIDWYVETIIAILLAGGVFLLLDQSVRRTLIGGLSSGLDALVGLGAGFLRAVANLVQNSRPADVVGFLLVLLALFLILLRVRWRLVQSARLTGRQCPRCGGPVHRIHRRAIDRAISFFVPVRRYGCRDGDCAWRGLRIGRGHDD